MIRNMKKFLSWAPAGFDGEFRWDFISQFAFPGTKIEPMDFDAVIERRGHTLIIETKETGKDIPKGQALSLANQWRLGATIMHLAGKTPETITGYSLYCEGEYSSSVVIGSKEIKPATWVDVSYVVHRWYSSVNKSKSLLREEYERMLWRWDYDRHSVIS